MTTGLTYDCKPCPCASMEFEEGRGDRQQVLLRTCRADPHKARRVSNFIGSLGSVTHRINTTGDDDNVTCELGSPIGEYLVAGNDAIRSPYTGQGFLTVRRRDQSPQAFADSIPLQGVVEVIHAPLSSPEDAELTVATSKWTGPSMQEHPAGRVMGERAQRPLRSDQRERMLREVSWGVRVSRRVRHDRCVRHKTVQPLEHANPRTGSVAAIGRDGSQRTHGGAT